MKLRRARSSRTIRVVLGTGILTLLASCTATPQSPGGWFGSAAPTPEPTETTPATAPQVRRVYYAGAEGLKVYSEPSTSSKVIGTLALHEKVVRTNLERGYAFVESTASELKGWVDNAQLIWRLPAASTTGTSTHGEAEPGEPEAPAHEEPSPTATTAPQPTPTAAVFPTIVPAPTAAPRELPTPRPINPSIFNPY
jgi:hypothetical protein